MARTVEAGGHVTLLTLTDGEAGFPDDDPRSADERPPAPAPMLSRSAMATIRVDDVQFLGVPDGAWLRPRRAHLVAAIISG